MLEFSDTQLDKIAIHNVGNRLLNERLKLSEREVVLEDDSVKDALLAYFLSSFKGEAFYQFTHESDLNLNEVYTYASRIFDDSEQLFDQSVFLAKHLFENSNHAKIKGGEFYVVYLRDCWVNDEEVDAIGLFKSENKDVFLKVYPDNNNYGIESQEGININKLDKGCLIFNTENEDGYLVSIVDATNKGDEAVYWKDYFLNIKPREDAYYYTQNYMRMCKAFVEDVYNEENEVPRADQIEMLNNTANFFKEREQFDEKEFEKKVIEIPENIQAFQDYKMDYSETNNVKVIDQFDISEPAFKNTKKFMKSVLKLDKNFHVYIHGDRKMIEKGYDDQLDLNYYKLYFQVEK